MLLQLYMFPLQNSVALVTPYSMAKLSASIHNNKYVLVLSLSVFVFVTLMLETLASARNKNVWCYEMKIEESEKANSH